MKRISGWIETDGLFYNSGLKKFVKVPSGEKPATFLKNPDLIRNLGPAPARLPYHQILALELTDRCNYSCPYCFEGQSRMNKRVMDIETARAAVDRLPPGSEIRFFGGEPLLCFDLIRQLTDLYPALTYSIVTNGSRLTTDMAKFMADHKFSVGLSYDGKMWQKKNRLSEGDSQAEFERAVELLSKAGIKAGISSVVTKESLPHIYDLHLEVFSEYDIGGWAYLLAFNTGINGSDLDLLHEQLMTIVDEFPAQHLYRINDLQKWALKATGEWPLDGYCGAGICYSAITASGEERVCPFFLRENSCFGPTLRAREIECRKCPIWDFCHGGCYAINQGGSGDTHRSHPLACKRNHIYFEAGLRTAAKKWAEERR